jgi:hypothetical protein
MGTLAMARSWRMAAQVGFEARNSSGAIPVHFRTSLSSRIASPTTPHKLQALARLGEPSHSSSGGGGGRPTDGHRLPASCRSAAALVLKPSRANLVTGTCHDEQATPAAGYSRETLTSRRRALRYHGRATRVPLLGRNARRVASGSTGVRCIGVRPTRGEAFPHPRTHWRRLRCQLAP